MDMLPFLHRYHVDIWWVVIQIADRKWFLFAFHLHSSSINHFPVHIEIVNIKVDVFWERLFEIYIILQRLLAGCWVVRKQLPNTPAILTTLNVSARYWFFQFWRIELHLFVQISRSTVFRMALGVDVEAVGVLKVIGINWLFKLLIFFHVCFQNVVRAFVIDLWDTVAFSWS